MQPRPGAAPSCPLAVLMPVRDAAPYLAEALASIFAQSHGDFVLLAVDDGSTDATPQILRACRDPRLRILNSRGQGIVDALLTGLSATDAPLIARMDADDLALPDRFARQFAWLAQNPDVAVLGAQVAHIDPHGRLTGHVSRFPTAPAEIARALPVRGCVLRHPTVVMRRAALETAAYRRSVEGAEDYDLWLRLSETHRLANLPDVLLHYRIHDAQASHGVNWRQRFAHDLALLSARARARREPDPLQTLDAPLAFTDAPARLDPALHPALQNLVRAYAAAVRMDESDAARPDAQSLRAMIDTTRDSLFGDGRRVRAHTMARAARAALRQGHMSLALQSARLAFEAAPARTLRWLLASTPKQRPQPVNLLTDF